MVRQLRDDPSMSSSKYGGVTSTAHRILSALGGIRGYVRWHVSLYQSRVHKRISYPCDAVAFRMWSMLNWAADRQRTDC